MVDRASSPHTVRDWMQRVDRRLSLMERHKHPTAVAEVAPPTGAGGLLGISVARGVDTEQMDITTGNGAGNPYQQQHFINYSFFGIDGGTGGLVPPCSLVTEPGAYGFDVGVTGMYQAYIEVGFTFDTAPEVVHWRFNTYNDYYEFTVEPHPGWGAAYGNNGGVQTFATPPFWEPAWSELDGYHYMWLHSQWRTLGHTMGSQFGNLDPTVFITIVRLA